jgi:hypothetical protein
MAKDKQIRASIRGLNSGPQRNTVSIQSATGMIKQYEVCPFPSFYFAQPDTYNK